MTHNSAHQQHIEWLKAQLAEHKQELAAAENKLAEIKAIVEQKKHDVGYFQKVLEDLISDSTGTARREAPADSGSNVDEGQAAWSFSTATASQNGGEPSSSIFFSESDHLEEEDFEDEDVEDEDISKRNPKDMLRAEFRGKTLGDAAQIILDRYRYPLDSDKIATEIFDPQSEDERWRAKNSLSTELRRGAKDGKWKKFGRGLFISKSVNFVQYQQTSFDTMNNGSTADS